MFGIKENHIDEERVIFLQLWIEVVRDEGDWKSGRSLILVLFISLSLFGFRCGGRSSTDVYLPKPANTQRLRFNSCKCNQRCS
jgi:hypothetical protein